jgi:MoxR-like ATPase
MARTPWAPDALYSAADRWVEECLRRGGSLFMPGQPVWTDATVGEAAEPLLIDDTRKLDYTTKLLDQTSRLSDPARQFTAELLYVQLLPIVDMKADAKRKLVEDLLGRMTHAVSIPDELLAALGGGVASYGAGNMQRDRYVKYFVRFAVRWTELNQSERGRLLDDPWAFHDFVHGLGGPALMQREAILHLVSPDTFEYALAPNDKAKIVKAFSGLPAAAEADNEDRALYVIRETVEAARGQPLNLYAPWFTSIWRNDEAKWQEAVYWAQRIFETAEFDQDERDYKFVVADHMRAARSAVDANDEDWLAKLKRAFGKPNNMTSGAYENSPFLQWCAAEPVAASAFLQGLWSSDDVDAEGVGEAVDLLTPVIKSPSSRLTLVSVLLLGVNPSRYPPYRVTAVSEFKKLIGQTMEGEAAELELEDRFFSPNELAGLLEIDGKRVRDFLRQRYPRDAELKGDSWELAPEQAMAVRDHFAPGAGTEPSSAYQTFLDLLDELLVRLLARGVPLRDRLDAQGLIWWIAKGGPSDSWTEEDKTAYLAFKNGESVVNGVHPKVAVPEKAWLIRGANVEGRNLVPEWIEQGFVSIGWPELGALPEPVTKEELGTAVADAYPDESLGSQQASVGNLNRFLNLMQPGHLVVVADGEKIYVGRLTGAAHYESGGFLHAVRRRSVEWLNAEEPASRVYLQSDFPSLYSRMRTLLTVTDLKEDVTSVAALVGLATKREVGGVAALIPIDDDLVKKAYLPREWLQEVIDLLAEKRQLIFYGPPGTGKTFLAQRLAEHLTSEGGAFEMVQFHPSYSYEDFFEGYRPVPTGDGMGVTYSLTPGPLRRIADAAAQDSQHPYVLMIDEINRGNLPKIFGELLFLLEYRDTQILLQFSPETQFGLPKNLYVIGTMNTADRSIALVDAALRRRFYFVPFLPTEPPVRDVLASWLKDKGLDDRPARLLSALNERIASEEIAIGPSYFMSPDSKAPDLARIWKHAILPVLEEHFYGVDRDVESEFGLDALEKAMKSEVDLEATSADTLADEADEAT